MKGQPWSHITFDSIELDGENRVIETGIIESSPDRHIQRTIGSKKFHQNLRKYREYKWHISSESLYLAQQVRVVFDGCHSLPHEGNAQEKKETT